MYFGCFLGRNMVSIQKNTFQILPKYVFNMENALTNSRKYEKNTTGFFQVRRVTKTNTIGKNHLANLPRSTSGGGTSCRVGWGQGGGVARCVCGSDESIAGPSGISASAVFEINSITLISSANHTHWPDFGGVGASGIWSQLEEVCVLRCTW